MPKTANRFVFLLESIQINAIGKTIDSGPFELREGEPLILRVFVDGGIVEVFANDRQALGRRFYPALGGTGVKLFAKVLAASSHTASETLTVLAPDCL